MAKSAAERKAAQRARQYAAVKTDTGGWRLFGVWRDQDVAVFVEAARGGIREWSGLNYLAEFVFSCGISLWEVHNKTDRKTPA
ncbi:hypothetical protein DQR98_21600 [Salmonella enterica subsp. enterica serovar Poona]|nr:hypothetical protein [Salmonella enterica]EBX3417067.1 hypothetical protein [Salmonella enterica subsp. enterica serovar Poona]HAE7669165.1 hypothetical protein [Salmonella enterica subsp. enterica serovar Muenchen]ECF9074713.1 hypothetical protein [Salmonella enterica]ECL8473804.1 hypothetical protein [Salmonella enterica]